MSEGSEFADLVTFQIALRHFMKPKKLSRPALGALSGVPAESIKNWADGTSEPERWEDIIRIAEVLKLDIAQINLLLTLANKPRLDKLATSVVNDGDQQIQELIFRCAPHLRNAVLFDQDERGAEQHLQSLSGRELPPLRLAYPRGSRVTYQPDDIMIGREDVLVQIATECKKISPRIIVLTGMGGVGKTRLAGESARRFGRYFLGGVFWISCADERAVPGEIAACGGISGLEIYNDSQAWTFMERVELVQSAWKRLIPRLLIFDNCESPDIINMYAPKTGGCRLIVTSRHVNWLPASKFLVIPVRDLSRADSILLLRRECPSIDANDTHFNSLAQELGGLPLALRVAGRFLELYAPVYNGRVDAYLEALRSKGPLQHESMSDGGKQSFIYDHDSNVVRTFEVSIGRLDRSKKIDTYAIQLLERAICFAPGVPIPGKLLLQSLRQRSGIDDESIAARAVRLLADLSIIEVQPTGDFLTHQLMRALVRDMFGMPIEAQIDVEAALMDAVRQLNDQSKPIRINSPVYGTLLREPTYTAVLQQLQFVTDAASSRGDVRAADLCDILAWQLYLVREFSQAQVVAERAITIREQCQSVDDPACMESREILALIMQMSGDHETAYALYMQVLADRLRVLGVYDARTADTYNNLGCLLMFAGGDYHEARRCLVRATRLMQRERGREHAETGRCLRNLGYVTMRLGRYMQAQKYIEHALMIFEAIQTRDRDAYQTTKAQTLMHLGELAMLNGNCHQAELLHQQALEIRKEVRRPKDRDIAESLWHLGCVALAECQYNVAENYLNQSLMMAEQAIAPNQLYELVRIIESLAALKLAQADLPTAQEYIKRAQVIWIKYGQHPERIKTRVLEGELALKSGNGEEAIHIFKEVYNQYLTIFRAGHPLVRNVHDLYTKALLRG